MDAIQAKQIDELFQLWQDHPGAGGQLVVNYKGEIFERCYGYANIETQTPITQDSVFHLASMSKQVTAMCIYMLYEQGKLDLDDDIKKYLGDIVHVPQKITINNMLHHTSGLPDHYNFLFLTGRSQKDTVTQAEILRLNNRITHLNFEPGDEFMYSNPNYVFLAEIVERLSGMTLAQFTKKYIFDPLGMKNTFFRDDPEMLIPNRVSSYHDNGYTYRNAILNLCMYGSTSLQSTARDMNLYLHQYKNPTLISRETMEKHMLVIPPLNNGKMTNYAGGVRIDEMLGHKYIHHGGVNAGFRTFGVYFPQDDLFITIFTNTYNIPIETAGRDVARVVLGLPPRTRKNLDAYKADSVDLDTVEGFYYCDKNGDNFNITVRDGVVYHEGVKLEPIGGNLFKQGRLDITFAFGENAAVNQTGAIMELRKITDEVPAEQAAEYVGRYFCEDYENFWEIRWEDGKLWLFHTHHGMMRLHWLGGDQFCMGLTKYTFLRDQQGKVVSFNRATSQLREMAFTKIS